MRFAAFFFSLLFPFITGTAQVNVSKEFINLGNTSQNISTGIKSFTINFTSQSSGGLTLVTIYPFELSINGVQFNDSLFLTNSLSGQNITIYTRATPLHVEQVFQEKIHFFNAGYSFPNKIYLMASSIPDNESFRVMSWNMKWFGSPSQCNCDTAVSRANAASLIKELDADLYVLQEIVNIQSLQSIVQTLGGTFAYTVSDYGSLADDTLDANYASCQKLAYIYDTTKFTNEKVYGLGRSTYPGNTSTTSPYWSFSSGRYPFLMKSRLKANNAPLIFVNLHAKAYTGTDEYNRRAQGAKIITDSLNIQYAGSYCFILGDYNDMLEGATTSGFSTSPYKYMLDNGYKGISLPSSYPGVGTYLGSGSEIIDNMVVKNNTFSSYYPNSFLIFSIADSVLNNFKSTTSDHLPVYAWFKNANLPVSTSNYQKKEHFSFFVSPDRGSQLRIFSNILLEDDIQIRLYTINGQVVKRWPEQKHEILMELTPGNLRSGIYFLQISTKKETFVQKVVIP